MNKKEKDFQEGLDEVNKIESRIDFELNLYWLIFNAEKNGLKGTKTWKEAVELYYYHYSHNPEVTCGRQDWYDEGNLTGVK